LAHEGLVKRIIGSHWGLQPRWMEMIAESKVEAFCLPQGQIAQLYRSMACGLPGKMSKVGLGTFIDPRYEGGKMNERTKPLKNIVDIFIAKKNNKILGGLICIKDGDTLHYNWGATLNFENIALGTVLINFAILYAKENEYNFFDLGSTPISDHALFDYKMRWGAINYPVYEYYTLFKPNQIDLNSSYIVSRQIYSKFPKSFLRWLMPKIIPYLVQ